MKGLLLMLALAAAILSASAVASANTGAATPFKAEYAVGGAYWTCSGARVDNPVSVKDSETCLVSGNTAGYVAGTYTGSPYGNFPPYGTVGWQSDFDAALASSWTLTITDNGDGTFTVEIVAYYST